MFVEARGADKKFLPGAFRIFAESETKFSEKIAGGQFRFTRDKPGEVTAMAHHSPGATLAWFPDWEAKKISGVVEPARAASGR